MVFTAIIKKTLPSIFVELVGSNDDGDLAPVPAARINYVFGREDIGALG